MSDKSVVRTRGEQREAAPSRRAPTWRSICFWDFGWVAFSGGAGPFADLDEAFRQTVERGYNTVRVDALPLTFFEDDGRPRDQVQFTPWPGCRARGIRWYDFREPATIRPADHLIRLLKAAKSSGCQVILSSWEYQQTLSLLSDSRLADRALAIPKEHRLMRLAQAWHHLISFLEQADLLDVVAYIELHNELNASMLSDVKFPYRPADMKQRAEEALDYLQKAHPDLLFTACYTEIGPHQLADLPDNIQVMHQHIYDWTIVEALEELTGVADGTYPTTFARSLLRADAMPFQRYLWLPEDEWRAAANDAAGMDWFHLHHACDPERFDAWLYSRWSEYRRAVLERIHSRLQAYALEARRRNIPAFIGEGWIGWWPQDSRFETSAAAKEVIGQATRWARDLGYEGSMLSSNFAPHHPEWADADWQRSLNEELQADGAGNEVTEGSG